jgi:hypothetical protein
VRQYVPCCSGLLMRLLVCLHAVHVLHVVCEGVCVCPAIMRSSTLFDEVVLLELAVPRTRHHEVVCNLFDRFDCVVDISIYIVLAIVSF